jgi:hypothetical protein
MAYCHAVGAKSSAGPFIRDRAISSDWERGDTMKRVVLLLVMGVLVLAACAKSALGPAEPAPTQAPLPTYTPLPTQTPYPTYTPVPTAVPTDTPIPTIAPATATPTTLAIQADTADVVLSAFRSAGIPISDIWVITAEDDPNELLGRPNQYIAKVSWKDTRITTSGEPGLDTGGTLEIFSNADDMQARKQYLEAVTKGIAFLAEYAYGNGTMLLRLSHELTPDQAKGYEDVFMKLP